MKHLVRAGGLLLGLLLLAFFLPRIVGTTTYLEGYGFYPRNDEANANEWASLPAQYAESSVCSSCHADKYGAWKESVHSTVNCEDCHSPGKAHIEEGKTLVADTSRELCGLCHAKVIGRPRSFPQVDIKTHGGVSICTTCHNPHNPSQSAQQDSGKPTETARPPAIPHTLEGRDNCLLCHSTGGIKPFPGDHDGRSLDTCSICHKSK
ncbi:MAG: cytochrome c3 family protein [Chloroflexota bacterium]